MVRTYKLVVCVSIVLLFPGIVGAQSVRGVVAGAVTDQSGGVVAGAKIEAKNQASGVISNTVSTSSGDYRFPELPLGSYDITVSAPGFKNTVLHGVLVQVQNVTALDVVLQVGEATQSITVDAGAPQVEAESSDEGGDGNRSAVR
jgi:carboxypeptidase family protein